MFSLFVYCSSVIESVSQGFFDEDEVVEKFVDEVRTGSSNKVSTSQPLSSECKFFSNIVAICKVIFNLVLNFSSQQKRR